ncbi:hypothetical protein Pelo_3049 [Pelomyxa schiedti]|nr:hypothetical protein Pelo_3049 [Pelomyxa schiedti]
MANKRDEILQMLNDALEYERSMIVQYGTCVSMLHGPMYAISACCLMKFVKEEAYHTCRMAKLIMMVFDAVPSPGMKPPTMPGPDWSLPQLVNMMIQQEQRSIAMYTAVRNKCMEYKAEFPAAYELLEDKLRHSIVDHERHHAMLKKMA